MNIAIVYGGKSGEHEVSLVSAASVVRHLNKKYVPILIGADHDGSWYLQPRSVLDESVSGNGPLALTRDPDSLVVAIPGRGLALVGNSESMKIDVVFPVLHGTFGEDGTVQGLLEVSGLPYVGCDVLGSAIAMDKEFAKALWAKAGLPVLPHLTVRRADWDARGAFAIRYDAEASFGYPMFVKPACGGSSVGAARISNADEFDLAVRQALEWDMRALIEPFIPAREIECSVIGNEEPRAFYPGEIVPTHEFYDYEAKYLDPYGASLSVRADLPSQTSERIMSIAVAAYKAAGLCGMARVDFFLDKRDGTVYLNEANTIPGFTAISMFPKMCEEGGLRYSDLLDTLVDLAISRKLVKDSVRYSR